MDAALELLLLLWGCKCYEVSYRSLVKVLLLLFTPYTTDSVGVVVLTVVGTRAVEGRKGPG